MKSEKAWLRKSRCTELPGIFPMPLLVAMAMLGLFPVTGQPLPLISRGGTSTLINCFYIGMILSVSRYAKQVKNPVHTQFDGPMSDIKHE